MQLYFFINPAASCLALLKSAVLVIAFLAEL